MTIKMEGKLKTCFLIAPIGTDGTETRRRSDDLLELAIGPALEKFGFAVLRADKIAKPSLITNDVIALVQQSELCIADLSDRNPNVFYEVGRRHETGKPIIQVIEKSQDIPFDLAGIRTIKYDISNPRSLHQFIQEIRSFVEAFENTEYAVPSDGISLATIAQSIERLERSVSKIAVATATMPAPVANALGNQEIDEDIQIAAGSPLLMALLGPRMQIEQLIRTGQIDEAAGVLVRARNRLGDKQYYQFAFMLCTAGNEAGMTLTFEGLDAAINGNALEPEEMQLWLGALVHFFGMRDDEAGGISKLTPIFAKLIKRYDSSPIEQAFVYNQMAKLHTGIGDLETALLYLTRATNLNPDEPAYRKNKDRIQKKISDSSED